MDLDCCKPKRPGWLEFKPILMTWLPLLFSYPFLYLFRLPSFRLHRTPLNKPQLAFNNCIALTDRNAFGAGKLMAFIRLVTQGLNLSCLLLKLDLYLGNLPSTWCLAWLFKSALKSSCFLLYLIFFDLNIGR